MARLLPVFVIVLASAGCSATSTATEAGRQERQPEPIAHADVRTVRRAPIAVPENSIDRQIRRDLNLALSHDPALRDRQISFVVTNGDISVNGIVRTEDERRKINELAMNIDGVKSVANAVLISD
jgi:osmotically-inducible protein OsmY